MKLEPKRLASYLPYKLKVYHKTFNEHSETTKSIIEELTTISYECASFANSMDYYFEDIEDNECDIKPILFPLSSLTKEITINGESFIPANKLGWEYCSGGEFGQITYCEYGENPKTAVNVLEYIDDYFKLLEWKFDVFGLIEAGLAEPVTEDFNPYK